MRKAAGRGRIVCLLVVGLWLLDVAVFYFAIRPARDLTGMYIADAARGYALKPGFAGDVSAGYSFPVRINSQGYRDREWRFDKEFRVLVAGNSFVFGLPLPIEDGFVAKARARFRDRVGFYAAGVPSYGVPHSLETIRRECPRVGARQVYYMSDFNDYRLDHMDTGSRSVVDGALFSNWAGDRKTRLATPLSPDEIERQTRRSRRAASWDPIATLKLLGIRTYLSQRQLHPRQLVERLMLIAGWGEDYFKRYLMTRPPEYSAPAMLAKAANMIVAMKTAATACGANFTFTVLPNATEAFYALREPSTEALLALLKGRDIDILDLRKYARPGNFLSLPRSGYYNRATTSWVATHIERHLRTRYPSLAASNAGG